MIPKIIWQTHEHDYENLPENFAKTSATWINLNPGWEYVYFNKNKRDNYVKTYAPGLYEQYTKIGKREQADIWRYLALYNLGGVYSDMDSVCIKPLDEILNNVEKNIEVIVTEKMIDSKINNANFAIIAKSSVMKEILDLINNEFYIRSQLEESLNNKEIDHKTFEMLLDEFGFLHYMHPWHCFNLALSNNSTKVSESMVAYHSDKFKKNFVNDTVIEYKNKKIPYLDFIKDKGLKEHFSGYTLKKLKKQTSDKYFKKC